MIWQNCCYALIPGVGNGVFAKVSWELQLKESEERFLVPRRERPISGPGGD